MMTTNPTKSPAVTGSAFVRAGKPNLVLHNTRFGDDGFGKYAVGTMTAREISEAVKAGFLQVKDDEQRGMDPVTGRELLKPRKIENWVAREVARKLFVGQLTYATFIEAGASTKMNGSDLEVSGPTLMPDGRQRTYTFCAAIERFDNGQEPGYDPDREVDVRLYLNLDSAGRKEVFAQMNGGRGGDHANESTVEWMTPEGHYQLIAKKLVLDSRHLGAANVNVVLNKVGRQDSRLSGFHTFVNAVEAGFKPKGRGELTQKEADSIKAYLPTFWDRLVDVRPELGLLPLGERQKARQELLTSNPLFVYGALAIAAQLFYASPNPTHVDLKLLEGLRGKDGDKFFSVDNQLWIDNGVMAPQFDRKTASIRGYAPRNVFQTRTAFAQATVDFMNRP